jgi:hypothetical protein
MRVSEMRGSECRPVMGRIGVASPDWDNITSSETEQTSRWCSNAKALVEPMKEAKQMTTALPLVQLPALRWILPSECESARKSVSRRSGLLLNQAASLFFRGAFLSARAV